MFKVLIEKQGMEALRNFFYDPKTNRAYSKGKTISKFVYYGIVMLAFVAAVMFLVGKRYATALVTVGLDWIYFAFFGLIGLTIGVLGSFAMTASTLFEAKDNEMLLAMPIPPKTILGARLFSVYMMDFLYTLLLSLPTSILYLIISGFSAKKLIGAIFFCILVGLMALIVSCIMGWIIAQLNHKFKNNNIFKTVISILMMVVFFVLNSYMTKQVGQLALDPSGASEKLSRSFQFLKLFGQVGTGDLLSIIIMMVSSLIILAVIIFILNKSFYKLALSSGTGVKTVYKEEKIKERTYISALLDKEKKRFFSSFTYMLNCGLGSLIILALGLLLGFFGVLIFSLTKVYVEYEAIAPMVIFAALSFAACMNYMVVPSVSLEGKNVWVLQSLPIKTKDILWSKMMFQLLMTGIPTFIASIFAIVGAILGKAPSFKILDIVFVLILPLVFVFCNTVGGMVLGLKMPNMTWTNETVPIKQNISSVIALFGGWVLVAILTAGYFFLGYQLGGHVYLFILTIAMVALSIGFICWINRKGVEIFESL